MPTARAGDDAQYREFQPCHALRPYIRSIFTFTLPTHGAERSWSRTFADGHVSIVFSFGSGYRVDGIRDGSAPGHVIGPMSRARLSSPGESLIQIGAYCRPAHSALLTGTPAHELADRAVALSDLWGRQGGEVEVRLFTAATSRERIVLFEDALLSRVSVVPEPCAPLDIVALARCISSSRGVLRLSTLTESAGVSRQHLTREFHRSVGITPKLYTRLARFRSALRYVRRQVNWAETAVACGYSDQSHMIAEFQQFSGRTPAQLAVQPAFHPFLHVRRQADARI